MADGTVHNYRYAQLAHARIFLCKLSISVRLLPRTTCKNGVCLYAIAKYLHLS